MGRAGAHKNLPCETSSLGTAEKLAPDMEQLQSISVISRQNSAMSHGLMDGLKSHTEIEIVQRSITKNTVFPALSIPDFFDLDLSARAKKNQPVIAPGEAFGFGLIDEPLITKQKANRFSMG